jgi:biopolymer transport protein ExbD
MPYLRRHGETKPISQINLTSLLDVTFVLLLAFMIVAPTLQTGLQIALPRVSESQPLNPTRKSFTISLRKMDEPKDEIWIYLDNKRVNHTQLRADLEDIQRRYAPDFDIVIEADRLAPCEALLKVFAVTQDVGIESVGMFTEPEEK